MGQHAVLGCDITDAVTALIGNTPTRLQASQNRTNPCNTATTVPVTTPGGNGSTTTTTTLPGTPTTQPPVGASVRQLLQDASDQFALAQQALVNKDLAGYQSHNAQAQADVQAALVKSGVVTTTTTVPHTTTTKAPVTTTTAKP